LPDASDTTNAAKLLSPTDFKLDPTRRPNGIRLIDGSNLSHLSENTYREQEKGLILVTICLSTSMVTSTYIGNQEEVQTSKSLEKPWYLINFYTRLAILNPTLPVVQEKWVSRY
jgi:hypothetical protein